MYERLDVAIVRFDSESFIKTSGEHHSTFDCTEYRKGEYCGYIDFFNSSPHIECWSFWNGHCETYHENGVVPKYQPGGQHLVCPGF